MRGTSRYPGALTGGSTAGSRPRVTTAADDECVSRPAISADAFDCSCRKGTYGVWIGHERAKHLCAPVVQRQWEEMEQTHYMRTSGGDRTARGRFRPSPILLLLPALSGGGVASPLASTRRRAVETARSGMLYEGSS